MQLGNLYLPYTIIGATCGIVALILVLIHTI